MIRNGVRHLPVDLRGRYAIHDFRPETNGLVLRSIDPDGRGRHAGLFFANTYAVVLPTRLEEVTVREPLEETLHELVPFAAVLPDKGRLYILQTPELTGCVVADACFLLEGVGWSEGTGDPEVTGTRWSLVPHDHVVEPDPE